MSSPDCKRQKLAGDVNSVAEMSNVSPKKDAESQTGDVTIAASASNKKSIIKQWTQLFKEVASLEGFVDRTMLIKELEDNEPVMIFAPSKFGKSINLNMFHFFYDIEDKITKTKEDVAKDPTMQELRSNPSEKMKVFLRQFGDNQYEECLILKEEKFVIQHIGRHPVISLNFKDCKPTNKSEATFECTKLVRKSYLENRYLKNSKELKSDNDDHVLLKQKCANWCIYNDNDLKKLSVGEVIDGLKDLIKSLKIHWGRDPVFLVDEIDKPCVAALREKISGDEVRKIGSVVSDVVCSILKSGEEELKLQCALITGISKFKSSGLSDVDNTVKQYFLGDPRFSKYYGLTAEEIVFLVRKLFASKGDDEITSIINFIKEHYNGYYQRSSGDIIDKQNEYARYCLFSVLSYLQERSRNKKVTNVRFWEEGGLIGNLVPILKKYPYMMSAIKTLMMSGTIKIIYQSQVDIFDLLGFFNEEMSPNPDPIFNFFLQRGFLAHNPEEEEVEGTSKIHVRIPNLEIKSIYEEMFKNYCASLSESNESALTFCGEFFQSLPTKLENFMEDSEKFQEDLNTLCASLGHIFNSAKCDSEASVCFYMCVILKLYAMYDTCNVEYSVQYRDHEMKPKCVFIDVYGKHGNFVLIVEVKYNVNATGEPGKLGSKTKSSLAAAEDIVKLLPGKKFPENIKCTKAGTGNDLNILKPEIKSYLLIGMAVDGNGTTHMLVFPNSTDWKDVITVNAESYVAELISTHLETK